MLLKTLDESKNLTSGVALPACIVLFVLGWGIVGLLIASHANITALQLHIIQAIPTYSANLQNSKGDDAKKEEADQPKGVEPMTLQLYASRKQKAENTVKNLQKEMGLPPTSKLEYLLGSCVVAGLLHPTEATTLLDEYTELKAFSLPPPLANDK